MGVWLFLSFAVVSTFSFVSVAVWVGTRHEERKQLYRSETLKKLAEAGPGAVIEYLREEEQIANRRRAVERERAREGFWLSGLILVAVGGALMYALRMIVPAIPVYLVSLAPIAVGVVLLLMPFTMRRRPSNAS